MGAQSQLSFEILLTINGISYSDISFCAFIRSPILKQSSFCLVKLFFSQPVLRQMISDIDRNKFPSITMTIYSKDEGKTKGNTNVVFVKTFLCIKVTPEGAIRFQEDKMQRSVNSGAWQDLSSSKVDLNGSFYIRKSAFPNRALVTIVIKIESKEGKKEERSEIYIQNSITSRSN